MMRFRCRTTAAFTAGIVLSALAVEAGLHAIERTPLWRVLPIVERELGWPDRSVGYTLRPHHEIINVRENRARARTNALGMRDRERMLAKPARTVRVAVLGDSVTEALQVGDDETFTRLAERAMNGGGSETTYEILNFGMSGAGPVEQTVRAASRAAALDPDAYVLILNQADVNGRTLTDDSASAAYVERADGTIALGHAFRARRSQRYRDTRIGRAFFLLMDHSRLARAVFLYAAHGGAAASAAAPSAPAGCDATLTRLRRDAARWQRVIRGADARWLDAWLSDVEAVPADAGAPVVVALYGLGAPRPECPDVAAGRSRLWRDIAGRFARHGIEARDLDALAAAAAGRRPLRDLRGFGRQRGGGHLNRDGHAVYAEVLRRLVRDRAVPDP